MTIALAESVIPRIDKRLIHSVKQPQSWLQLKANYLAAVNDKSVWWQTKKFAAYFKARSIKNQVLLLGDLHQFVYHQFPYGADGFKQQEIKQPAICFHYRHEGVDCKDKTRLILDCCRHLGISASLVFLGFEPKEKRGLIYVRGHVYLVVYIGGERIVIDATLPNFGEEYQDDKIIHKEEILCC